MRLVPISHADANAFVAAIHRHNGGLPTSVLRAAVVDDDGIVRGVAIAGLPKARMLCRPGTLEVNRVCTDGAPNACSMLYGAIRRAAKALGYVRLVTYTVAVEDGASLKASGWRLVAEEVGGGSWAELRGTGYGNHDEGLKRRWQIDLGDELPAVRLPKAAESPQLSLVEAV